jgi:hypothetical protein
MAFCPHCCALSAGFDHVADRAVAVRQHRPNFPRYLWIFSQAADLTAAAMDLGFTWKRESPFRRVLLLAVQRPLLFDLECVRIPLLDLRKACLPKACRLYILDKG